MRFVNADYSHQVRCNPVEWVTPFFFFLPSLKDEAVFLNDRLPFEVRRKLHDVLLFLKLYCGSVVKFDDLFF